VVKVSLVSYLNSLPFKWGLENYISKPEFELVLDYPAELARKLISQEVNVGLVPVAVIPQIVNAQIISPYGIGAYKQVDSVLMVSNYPLNEIETVWLDYQSKTSVNLLKVLAFKFWNKSNWKFEAATEGYLNNLQPKHAAVVIGDRALQEKNKYTHVFDLATEWYNFTQLPFVFAAWVSNTQLSENWIKNFNNSLKYGIENISQINLPLNTGLTNEQITDYLTKKIKYKIGSEAYQKAVSLFLSYKRDIEGC